MTDHLNLRSRTGRRCTAVAAAIVAVLALGVLLTASANATRSGPAADRSPARAGAEPTVVFVHGAWADSSGWNGEIRRLQADGYRTIAVANPLRGLTYDADYTRSVLRTIDGPIVLVGHSYGGAVITNAARGVPNVKALVYISAFAPNTGETIQQLVTKYPGTKITPAGLILRPYPLPGGGTDDDLYIKPSNFRDAFAGDLPVRETRLMAAEQRPFANIAFTQPSGAPAWKTVPSWYLESTQDHAIPPAAQEFMSHRAHSRVTEVASSHVPMMSHPGVTTRVILKAIHATA